MVAVPVAVALGIVFAVLLQPALFPEETRQAASGAGFLLGGLVTAVSCQVRAVQTTGRRRRSWQLLVVASLLAVAANVWVAVSGSDPIDSPSAFGDLLIATALVVSIAAVLTFPSVRRRGIDLLVMSLDGLIMGAAVLIIASVLVYSELLDNTAEGLGGRFSVLIFPLLDVVLATVALLLVVRSRGTDRPALGLVAAGFVMYAVADMAFAVLVAQETFEFGTPLDLGWIYGYFLIALAAWYPSTEVAEPAADARGGSEARDTMLVFSVLLVAAFVQVGFGTPERLQGAQVVLWSVLIAAAGARQTLLTRDNTALRRGLERRVREQTADLRRLARQNEVLLSSVGDGIYGVDHEGRVSFVNPSGAKILGYEPDALLGLNAHDEFHAPTPEGAPYPWEGCYVTDAIQRGHRDQRRGRRLHPPRRRDVPGGDHRQPAPRRGRRARRRGRVPRRHPAARGRPDEERVPLGGQPRAAYAAHLHPRLARPAGRRHARRPHPARPVDGEHRAGEHRAAHPPDQRHPGPRADRDRHPPDGAVGDRRPRAAARVGQGDGRLRPRQRDRLVTDAAPGRVLADRDRIVQTLTNLLGNSIKFSAPGSTVRLSTTERDSEVVFTVSDEGRGIPADKLEAIFERFEQVDSSDARQEGGTGLGLAISRGIVERHGGRIWAESEVGVGTTVLFSLPKSRRGHADGEEESPDAPLLLVCDDDEPTVDLFSAMLRRHGYRTFGVTDGAAAVARAISDQPAAVLLDLRMPGTTGADVLSELKASELTHHIPVIVISGLSPDTEPQVETDAADWLIKPVTEERLVQTVSTTLSHRESHGIVLLVEDDEDLAGVISALLGGHGLEVAHAATAGDAVRLGQEIKPDVIVLDLHLPDGDGSAVVSEFRRTQGLSQTPLVVYSAADVEENARGELQLGETVFLTKGRAGPEAVETRVLQLVNAITRRPAGDDLG